MQSDYLTFIFRTCHCLKDFMLFSWLTLPPSAPSPGMSLPLSLQAPHHMNYFFFFFTRSLSWKPHSSMFLRSYIVLYFTVWIVITSPLPLSLFIYSVYLENSTILFHHFPLILPIPHLFLLPLIFCYELFQVLQNMKLSGFKFCYLKAIVDYGCV